MIVHACGVKCLFVSDSQQVKTIKQEINTVSVLQNPSTFIFFFVMRLTAPKWKENGDLKGVQPNLSCP